MTFDDYLEMRLTQWAEWFIRNRDYLNYPSCSIEYRMMTEGVVIHTSVPAHIPSHEEADEIEALVNEMAMYEKTMAQVLRERYFGKGSILKRATKLGISYEQFRIFTVMARQWLGGRLSASSNFSKIKKCLTICTGF